MPKEKDPAPAEAPPAAEPANIAIETIGHRVKVGKAICSGPVPFGITKPQADALVAAGLARIIGVF